MLLFVLLWAIISDALGETSIYSGCDIDSYYSSISPVDTTTREEIGSLLKSTHQNVLPYTSQNREDTWDALSDLDAGDFPGTVRLIYAQTSVVTYNWGDQSRSWNREHLWPKSHGVEYNGADFSDLHHLRPSDSNVNSSRGNKYFSNCGIASDWTECRKPAHPEAEKTTATDSIVWLPPKAVRGDIARALFYMDHRYFGEGGDPNLELTDCPTRDADSKLAYLSQLLEWHRDDPVDEEERARNQRVCERWQGNRNIFVDFPDLVASIYGKAHTPNGALNGYGYNCADIAGPSTPSPAPSTVIDDCKDLKAGDVQVIGVHSDNPDEIALVALENIPPGLEIFMSDDAWTGGKFRGNEGKAKLLIPKNGIAKGTVFGYGLESDLYLADSWEQMGSLALSTNGDSIIVYCEPNYGDSYNFLAALTYDGSWATSDFDSNKSALPSSLTEKNTVLDHKDNYKYIGPVKGTKNDLVSAIGYNSNWVGYNSAQSFQFESFSICSDCTPSNSRRNPIVYDETSSGAHDEWLAGSFIVLMICSTIVML